MQAAPSKPRQPCKPQGQAQRGLQQGFVAVLLIVMMAVATVAALTMNLWGGKGEAQAYDKKLTREALRQAKQALLARIETGGLPAGGAVPADIQALLFKINSSQLNLLAEKIPSSPPSYVYTHVRTCVYTCINIYDVCMHKIV